MNAGGGGVAQLLFFEFPDIRNDSILSCHLSIAKIHSTEIFITPFHVAFMGIPEDKFPVLAKRCEKFVILTFHSLIPQENSRDTYLERWDLQPAVNREK